MTNPQATPASRRDLFSEGPGVADDGCTDSESWADELSITHLDQTVTLLATNLATTRLLLLFPVAGLGMAIQ